MTSTRKAGRITRSLIRWHGGKTRDAPWICRQLGPHDTYVEPYGGGASVLMRKPKAKIEVLNELDDGLVNLYRVVADPARYRKFRFEVWLTKFCRATLKKPEPSDPVERAAWLVSRGNIARNASLSSGYRGDNLRDDGTSVADDHANYRHSVQDFHERLRDVVICQEPAIDVMLRYDSKQTLHYCDPPYLHDERLQPTKHTYPFEMEKAQHVELLECLMYLRGMVVLSGYDSALYNDTLVGWEKYEKKVKDNGDNDRVECLWLNPPAVMCSMVHHAAMHERLKAEKLARRAAAAAARRLAKHPGQLDLLA